MVFPKNNLPTQSQPWTRDVEKRVENLESTFRSAEVNNVTRDSQILSQIRRIDAATTEVQGIINNIYVTGTEEINGAVLAENTVNGSVVVNGTLPGGKIQANTITATQIATNYVYAGSINAGQIDAGTINGININGSTITGSTLTTASPGNQRVILNSNNMTLNNGSVDTGSVYGSTYGGQNSLNMISTNGWVLIGNGSSSIVGGTNPSAFTALLGNTQVNQGSFSVEGAISGSSDIRRTELIGGGLTGASFTNGGNLVRTSSSQRYKTDIQLLNINLNDLYELQPKTFKRIEEVEEDAESARTYPGFIAEELAGTSLDKFVFYSKDQEGNLRPEGIHYPELTAALLLAIKDLNARIQVLESQV